MDSNNPNNFIPLRKAVLIILAIILPVVIFVVVAMLFMFTDLFTRRPPEAIIEEIAEEPYYDPEVPVLDVRDVEEMFALEPGEVATIAGTGLQGSADGISAEFNMPADVVVGGSTILVADTYNNALRLINADGRVETLAGAVHPAGAERFPIGFYIDGEARNVAFNRPVGLAVQASRVFIADGANHAIRVMVNGQVYTISGLHGQGHADGGPLVSMFDTPRALAFGPSGYLYVADTGNHAVRRISPMGYVTTIAGVPGQSGYANGAATEALFYSPMGITVTPDGRVFVADTGNHLIRVISDGIVSTLAGSRDFLDSEEHDGHVDGWDDAPIGGFVDGFGAMARFNQPMGLDIWGGNLVVADSASHSIRLVSLAGDVTTLTGSGYPGYMSGDRQVAEFHFPTGVYVLGDFLFIADSGNNKIRLKRFG